MPRKQRFKPSRKPKPIPQTEEPMIDRTPSSANSANNDNIESRTPSNSNEGSSSIEPEPDQQSR